MLAKEEVIGPNRGGKFGIRVENEGDKEKLDTGEELYDDRNCQASQAGKSIDSQY